MSKQEGSEGTTDGDANGEDLDQYELNGDVDDLKKIQSLYDTDHELEALEIIDRVLGLSGEVASELGRLAKLVAVEDSYVQITADTSVYGVQQDRAILHPQTKLGPSYTPPLLAMRSKCFVALLDTKAGNSNPKIRTDAVKNAEMTLELFPGHPEYLIWAAQVYFLTGQLQTAVALGEKAQSIAPDNQMIITTMEMITGGNTAGRFAELTHQALTLINEFAQKCSETGEVGPDGEILMEADHGTMELLKRANELLQESIDIHADQAKAWAGLSWMCALLRKKEEAFGYLREAQKIDPSDEVVVSLARELHSMGWTVERATISSGQGWTTAGGSPNRAGITSASLSPPLLEGWTFDDCAWIQGGIVVSGLTAVFGDREGIIHAVDTRSGKQLWEYSLGGLLCGYPEIQEQRVYAGRAGYAVSLDLATGERIWESGPHSKQDEFNLKIVNSPLCIGRILIFSDDSLAILSLENGEILYSSDSGFDANIHTGPCANEQFAFIPGYKEIYRLNLAEGQFDQSTYTQGKIISGPVVANDYLIFGNNRSSVVAMSADSLEMKWSFRVEGQVQHLGYLESRPAICDDRVFFGGPDGFFYALSLDSGQPFWKTDLSDYIASPALVCDDVVYVLTDSAGFYALSATSGKIIWEYDSAKKWQGASFAPAIAGHQILIGWDRLYSFRPA